jgi:hypothetical protein
LHVYSLFILEILRERKLIYSLFKNENAPTGEMIISNDRYQMQETENSMYAVQMMLVIRKLQKSDMGGYKCISKNSIGDAEGTIRIYGEFKLFYIYACEWGKL